MLILSAGFSTLLLTTAVMGGYIAIYGTQSFSFIYDHWVGLVTAALLNSAAQVSASSLL